MNPGRPLPSAATLGIIALATSVVPGAKAAPTAQSLFDAAVAADLAAKDPADAARAFQLYRGAAVAGLAQAQLNVAVMYDSGRGIPHDAAQAAIWYAAAATGGVARAAFDLGQLYEAGDGVPQNAGLAHAWFSQAAAQGLAAASNRPLRADRADAPAIAAPTPSYPPPAATLPASATGMPLVWTAQPTPAPAAYFVQVMATGTTQPAPAYASSTTLSAIRMLPARPGRYAWRVFMLCPSLGRYIPSAWSPFAIATAIATNPAPPNAAPDDIGATVHAPKP